MKLILIPEEGSEPFVLESPKVIVGYLNPQSSDFEVFSNLGGYELVGVLEKLKITALLDHPEDKVDVQS